MNDKELLELAAKAAGIANNPTFMNLAGNEGINRGPLQSLWNPLTDDGDALRLAVKLGISITPYPIYATPKHSVITKQRNQFDTLSVPNKTECMEVYGSDPASATRRAIVRAAAEIGKRMK